MNSIAALKPFLAWLESTALAHAVGQSLLVTASVSAVHVLGFALVMGGALLADLRLLGLVLPRCPVEDVAVPASRVIGLGLLISIATGLAMFSWQARTVLANGTFQLKMLLLAAAALYHFAVLPRALRGTAARPALRRAAGAAGLALWLGVGVAGAAFILFE